MLHPVVIPGSWWQLPLDAGQRPLHLLLLALADRDGLCRLDSAVLVEQLGMRDVELDGLPCVNAKALVVRRLRGMAALGVLALYEASGAWWTWLPHVAEYQPAQGALARERDPALPPPPREAVVSTLGLLWSRTATEAEARAACPRAWGRTSRARGAGGPTEADVERVWQGWRDRQDKPGACRLGDTARAQVRRALREATPEQLLLLLRFAYEADDAGPRFWRGENANRRTYLGLDNLLVASKLQGRLQNALAWAATQGDGGAGGGGDGTSYGALANYRDEKETDE